MIWRARKPSRADSSELERLLSTEEVAEALGRPARTLRQWRYIGEGPKYLKVGATVRYRARDVEAWLESRVQDPGMHSGTHP